jgi:pimeloyl-ACP methyl ester carboxylesterase
MFKDVGSWQTVEWQPVIAGMTRDIAIDCLVSPDALSADSDPSYVYGGYSEEGLALRAAVKTLNRLERPSIGVNLPDRFIGDAATLELVAKEAPVAVAEWFNDRRGNPTDKSVDVLAHSKGAGVMLIAGNEAPERFGAFGLIGPIGVTNEFLGTSDSEKIRNYFWRIAVLNNLEKDHNPFTDPSNLVSFCEFALRVTGDLLHGRLRSKLESAFNLDLAPNVARLAQDHQIRVFLGEDDKLFTTEEYRKSLGDSVFAANTVRIPGSHSALVSRMGRHQLELASDWLEKVRSQRT